MRAVDDVDLELRRGEVVGLVGESGSGKTTLGRAILGLAPVTAGRIVFDGQDVAGLSRRRLRRLRRRAQMIFQDPYSSLSPRLRVSYLLTEPYRINRVPESEQHSVDELLAMVELSSEQASKYPHELSGGQARRVGIARALALNPEFLVADEPTSGLDVSAAAAILNLMKDLGRRLGLTYLVITHNLGVVGYHRRSHRRDVPRPDRRDRPRRARAARPGPPLHRRPALGALGAGPEPRRPPPSPARCQARSRALATRRRRAASTRAARSPPTSAASWRRRSSRSSPTTPSPATTGGACANRRRPRRAPSPWRGSSRGTRMRIRTDFERRVRTIANTWITLADGTRLAARIWLPEDAETDPVPAILEYIPYRKDDGTATRDAIMHPWFAGHGYAAVRVDQRGSGDSDGLLLDEYLPQEQDDALEVLEWLAAQPWCTGRDRHHRQVVGRLQRPADRGEAPARARRSDLGLLHRRSLCDGRALHGRLPARRPTCCPGRRRCWPSTRARRTPPFVGERWRELWLERLEHTPPFAQAWIAHQRRDAFWKHGSVCEEFDAIQVPVYMVGGWQDAYTDAVFRFLGGYGGPAKGLVGPWGHLYPQSGAPGPAIGFLQECLRFWDHCLKADDNRVLDEPALRVFMQEWVDPTAGRHTERPGRWVAEPVWPPLDARRTRAASARRRGSRRAGRRRGRAGDHRARS